MWIESDLAPGPIAANLRAMYVAEPADPRRDRFVDQFEPDGDGWLYRYRNVGPALRVTENEMDAFVAAYDRQARWSFPIALAIIVGLFVLLFTMPWFRDPDSGHLLWWVPATGPLFGLAITRIGDFFAFRIPMRALAGRTPVAPPVSTAERQQLALDRTTEKGLIGWVVLAAGLLSFLILTTGWPHKLPDVIFSGLCVAIIAWAAVQGTRKWLSARTT